MGLTFNELPPDTYGAILADPPWRFQTWSPLGMDRSPDYETMTVKEIWSMPVGRLAKRHAVLFLWVTWPMLEQGIKCIRKWGFVYKTCAFAWVKADVRQMEMFDDANADMGTGYWTRANSEVCLLGTKGRPRRIDAGVRQGIIEPRREHSRKPTVVQQRIEKLVSGPYLELFARAPRYGWTTWGAESNKFPGTNFPLTLASNNDPGVA